MVTLGEETSFNVEVDKALFLQKQNRLSQVDEDGLPWIETPKKLIHHLLPFADKSFDDVGYFVYRGVKIYETGTHDAVTSRSNDIHDKVFPQNK